MLQQKTQGCSITSWIFVSKRYSTANKLHITSISICFHVLLNGHFCCIFIFLFYFTFAFLLFSPFPTLPKPTTSSVPRINFMLTWEFFNSSRLLLHPSCSDPARKENVEYRLLPSFNLATATQFLVHSSPKLSGLPTRFFSLKL